MSLGTRAHKLLNHWYRSVLNRMRWLEWLDEHGIRRPGVAKPSNPPATVEALEPRLMLNGTLEGSVFYDANRDWLQSPGESGMEGWAVYLDDNANGQWDAEESRTITDAQGHYLFSDLSAGTHRIAAEALSGWSQTTWNAQAWTVDLAEGQQAEGFDFGMAVLGQTPMLTQDNDGVGASISGTLFYDVNQDWMRSYEEPFLQNWSVYLDTNGNGAWDSGEAITTTDETGAFSFTGLAAGEYDVRAEAPTGWQQTTWNGEALKLRLSDDLSMGPFHLGLTLSDDVPGVWTLEGVDAVHKALQPDQTVSMTLGTYEGTLETTSPTTTLQMSIFPALTSLTEPMLLGFRVETLSGDLVPATVQIIGTDGSNPTILAERTGDTESVVVASLTQGQYELEISGDFTDASEYRLTTYVVGDADGDNVVHLEDLRALDAAMGSQTGDAAYQLTMDANLDGQITESDFNQAQENFHKITPALSVEELPAGDQNNEDGGEGGGVTGLELVTLSTTRSSGSADQMFFPSAYYVPGDSAELTKVMVFWDFGESQYIDEFGYFFIDNPNGEVSTGYGPDSILGPESVLPGQAGYEFYAMAPGNYQVVFSRDEIATYDAGGDGYPDTAVEKEIYLPGNSYIAFYLIQDGTTTEWRENYNEGLDSYNIWFSYTSANSDNYPHFQLSDSYSAFYQGGTQLAIEDLSPSLPNSGGYTNDADYNDAVISLYASNSAPTDISPSNSTVDENIPGVLVGTLTTTDSDPWDTHTYSLVSDPTGLFTIVGDELRLKEGRWLDYETISSVTLRIRSTDDSNLYYEKDIPITVNNTNDAPTLLTPMSCSTMPNTSVVFTGDSAITVGDEDSGTSDISVTISTASGSNGTLAATNIGGLTSYQGHGTGTLIMVGTVSAINTALDGLTYTPETDYEGSDSLSILVSDQGNTGSGGPNEVSGTILLSIVDDLPVVTLIASDYYGTERYSTQEADTVAFTFSRGDADEGDLTVLYEAAGTANADDFSEGIIPGSVVIPDGETSVTIVFTPYPNGQQYEGYETLSLTLKPSSDYGIGSSYSDEVLIADVQGETLTFNDYDTSFGDGGWTYSYFSGISDFEIKNSCISSQGEIAILATFHSGSNVYVNCNLYDYLYGGYHVPGYVPAYTYTVVLKFNADGTADTNFGNDGSSIVCRATGCTGLFPHNEITFQDDKILLGGYWQSSYLSRPPSGAIIRLNSDGTRDGTFGYTSAGLSLVSDNVISSIEVLPDGKIVAGCGGVRQFNYSDLGTYDVFDAWNFSSDFGITGYFTYFGMVGFNSNGTLNTSFGVDGFALHRGNYNKNLPFIKIKYDESGNPFRIISSQVQWINGSHYLVTGGLSPSGENDSLGFSVTSLEMLDVDQYDVVAVEDILVQSNGGILVQLVINPGESDERRPVFYSHDGRIELLGPRDFSGWVTVTDDDRIILTGRWKWSDNSNKYLEGGSILYLPDGEPYQYSGLSFIRDESNWFLGQSDGKIIRVTYDRDRDRVTIGRYIGASDTELVNIPFIAEDGVISEGGDSDRFIISRDSNEGALTVKYSVSGTADRDDIIENPYSQGPEIDEYGWITIPDGAYYVTIPITAVDDLLLEETEDISIVLLPGGNYVSSYTSATIQIIDNDTPVAESDTAETDEDASVDIYVLANDTPAPQGGDLEIVSVTQGEHGTVVNYGDYVTYIPDLDWYGTDTFAYIMSDELDRTNTATVSVTVQPVNDAPVVEIVSTREFSVPRPLAINPLNIIDDALDGDELLVEIYSEQGEGTITLGTTGGLLFHNGDGTDDFYLKFSGTLSAINSALASLTYTPLEDPFFTWDYLTVKVNDEGHFGSGEPLEAIGSCYISQAEHLPEAISDEVVVFKSTAVDIDVLANDFPHPNNSETLTISEVTQGTHGSVVIVTEMGESWITYTPEEGYLGEDSFEYTISNDGYTDTATVYVTVEDYGSISGYVFHDRNRNHLWDQYLIQGEEPDIIYIVDISGSTEDLFHGTSVGDLNGDGIWHWDEDPETGEQFQNYSTILDAEIAGFMTLNQTIINMGLGDKANVSLIVFADHDDCKVIDVSRAAGNQTSTNPQADVDGNGIPDIVDALCDLQYSGGTYFADPLIKAKELFEELGTTSGNANIFFLSDGVASDIETEEESPIEDAVDDLRNSELHVNIRAFGVGESASMDQLCILDPQAFRFHTTDQIFNAFSGMSGDEPPELGLGGITVYVDYDRNGIKSEGDAYAVTAEDGSYVLEFVRETSDGEPGWDIRLDITSFPQGDVSWISTTPLWDYLELWDDSDDYYEAGTGEWVPGEDLYYGSFVVRGSELYENKNFGLVEDPDEPTADGLIFTLDDTVDECTPLTVTVDNPVGYEGDYGLRYSYDFNNDGDFLDPGELYRFPNSSTMFLAEDGSAEGTEYEVRVLVHDAAGQVTEIIQTYTAMNVAPEVYISGPSTADLSSMAMNSGKPVSIEVFGEIYDLSLADTEAGFDCTWKIIKDNDEQNPFYESPEPEENVDSSSLTFIPDGPGEYAVTFYATDKDGGCGEVTKTITVTRSGPAITAVSMDDHVCATPTNYTINPYESPDESPASHVFTVYGATATFAITADDDGGEEYIRYVWEVELPEDYPSGLQEPTKDKSNGWNSTKEVTFTFYAPGEYKITAYAIEDGKYDLYDWYECTVTVESTATTVEVGPSMVALEEVADPGNDTYQFTATVLDQFGEEISNPTITWSDDTQVAGTINSSTGVYTYEDDCGVEEITATVQTAAGSVSGSAQVSVRASAEYPILGSEGVVTQINENEAYSTDNVIAVFLDSDTSTSLNDYTATIDWGDGTSTETGVVESYTDTENNIDYWIVKPTTAHQYANYGTYTYQVTLDWNSTRSKTISGDIEVLPAEIQPIVCTVDPITGVLNNKALFRFASTDLTDAITDYKADIDWGDESSDENVSVEWKSDDGGYFEIKTSHTYLNPPTEPGEWVYKTITITLKKIDDDEVWNQTWEYKVPILIESSVFSDTPCFTKAYATSSSEVYLEWPRAVVDYVWDDMNWELNPVYSKGYIIWAYNPQTGEKRRIPGDVTKKVNSSLTRPLDVDNLDVDAIRLCYVDQYLEEGITCYYTIQGIRADGTVGKESSCKEVTTLLADVEAGQPYGVQADNVLDDEGAVVGVQLTWEPGDVAGYRVFRKVEDGGITYWKDLTSEGTTSYTSPVWTDTVTVSEDPVGSGNYTADLIDPEDVLDNGKVGYYHAFDETEITEFGTGEEYEYVVIAYVIKEDGTLVSSSPVLTSEEDGDVVIAVSDNAGPSAPTNVQAASYPQAIQITWDDRPEEDDNSYGGFGGWWLYRWTGTSSPDYVNYDDVLWVALTDTPIVNLGYDDFTADEGLEYHYMLRATDQLGNLSDPVFISHQKSIHGEPDAPAGFMGQASSSTSITLSWETVVPVLDQGHENDALAGYRIERYDSTTELWEQIHQTDVVTETSYNDDDEGNGLATDTQYMYRICTVDLDGDYSIWAETTAHTGDGLLPGEPVLGSPTITTDSIILRWQEGTGDDSTKQYCVYRSSKDGSQYIFLGLFDDIADADNTLTVDNLAAGTEYTFKIYAIDEDGELSTPEIVVLSTTSVTTPEYPYVEITSHPSGDTATEITADTKIYGIVDDVNNNLASWELYLTPLSFADMTSDIVIASGDTEVGDLADGLSKDSLLGTIQPTLLQNGLYKLVLEAVDTDAQTSVTEVLVQIQTDVKIGQFTLPMEDMVIDVPGQDSIVISRVYDSSRADEMGDFGYGWFLELTDTNLRTTAGNTQTDDAYAAMREGDLVYINIPGRGLQTFMFLPKVSGDQSSEIPIPGYILDELSYYEEPRFISVDGSASTLEVNWDTECILYKDPETGEFWVRDTFSTEEAQYAYNPAHPQQGGQYTLKTQDGYEYIIDALTGSLIQSTDPHGNVTTYDSDYESDSTTDTEKIQAGETSVEIIRDKEGKIIEISSKNGMSVTYVYDGDLLSTVTDSSDCETEYQYTSEYNPHYLTGVIDSRDIQVITVEYDSQGKVTTLTDNTGQSAEVDFSGFDGISGGSSTTDPEENETEQIFDSHGNVIREIQTVKNYDGEVHHYVITVHKYEYHEGYGDGVDPYEDEITLMNMLKSETHWESFIVYVNTSFAAGLQYTAKPSDWGANKLREVLYYDLDEINGYDPYAGDDPWDWGVGLVYKEKVYNPNYLEPMLETVYSDYMYGKPQKITDPYGNITENHYDEDGNLEWTENSAGDKTYYRYTNDTTYADNSVYEYIDGLEVDDYAGLAKGLLLETYTILPDETTEILLSRNVYYGGNASDRQRGCLKSTTDAAGLTTRYTYWNDGNVKEVFREWEDSEENFHSVCESYTEYDDAGRVILTRDAYGRETRTFYNEAGQTLVTIDAYGGMTAHTYDIQGNEIRTISSDGIETRSVYDDMGRLVYSGEGFVGNSSFAFNEETNTLTWVNNDSTSTYTVTKYLYDTLGRERSREQYIDSIITIELDLNHEALGLYITSLDEEEFGELISTTNTDYDDQGRVCGVDVFGSYELYGTQTGYYANGQVGCTRPVIPCVLGYPPLYPETRTYYEYNQVDGNGDYYDLVTDPHGKETRTYKDSLGRVIKTVYADGSFTEVLYGSNHQQVDRADISVPDDIPDYIEGRHEVHIAQRNDGDPVLATHYLYDAAGRLTDVWLPAVDDPETPETTLVYPHYHYEYDVNGNQISITDPEGQTTTFTYDEMNRQTGKTLPLGQSGELGTGFEEKKVYNDTIIDPSGLAAAWSVGFGQLEYEVDVEGRVVAYRYDNTADAAGRLVGKYYYTSEANYLSDIGDGSLDNDVERVEYTYDDYGRQETVTKTVSGSGSETTTYAYDDITGQVTMEDSPQGTIWHEYDPVGTLVRTYTGNEDTSGSIENDGVAVTDTHYSYHPYFENRLATAAATERNDSPISSETTSYSYDVLGNLLLEYSPNGVITEYHYDDLYRLDVMYEFIDVNDNDQYDSGVDTLMAGYDYTVDADGKRTMVEEKGANDVTIQTFYWAYDALGRLIGEAYDNASDDTKDYITSYTLDLVGNRIEKATDVTPDSTDFVAFDSDAAAFFASVDFDPTEITDYTYDANDRLLVESYDSDGDSVTDQTTVYEYGPNASLATEYGGDGTEQTKKSIWLGEAGTGTLQSETTYTYNLQGRMVQVDIDYDADTNIDLAELYIYDDSGIRVGKEVQEDTDDDGTVDDTTTLEYVIDANNHTGYAQILEEWDVSGATPELVKSYTLGHDVLAQADDTNGVLYLLADGHGSTRMLVDSSGEIAENDDEEQQIFTYDAYGNMLTTFTGDVFTSILYSGEQFDSSTGLQYLRARYYNPANGRFNRLDPFAGNSYDPQSLHKYLYVNNNPIGNIDPSGEFALLDIIGRTCITTLLVSVSTGSIVGSVYQSQGMSFWSGFTTGGIIGGSLYLAYITGGPKGVVKAFFTGGMQGLASASSRYFSDYAQNPKQPTNWKNLMPAFMDGFSAGVARNGIGGYISEYFRWDLVSDPSKVVCINASISSVTGAVQSFMSEWGSGVPFKDALINATFSGIVNGVLSAYADAGLAISIPGGTESALYELAGELFGFLLGTGITPLVDQARP